MDYCNEWLELEMAEKTANKQVPSILNGCFVDQRKFHDDMIFNVPQLNIRKRF